MVPVISEDLNVSALSLKAVVTTYTLSLAVFIPISGWMADRFGTRKVFRTAVALFTLGSLLCGLSVNLNMLVASRVIQGIGGAMMTPVGRVVLVRTFPREDLLRVMNVVIPALIAPMAPEPKFLLILTYQCHSKRKVTSRNRMNSWMQPGNLSPNPAFTGDGRSPHP